ncbi:serine/threonine-protein kinase [Cellvibrio sp. pealriver]|uniref:serine/threonine-protein kinase n=1 Tax=Cellvibrio sp. pealriver TaxID=1622269 RepID=UPI00066FE813|nr:serine/threonine-protein kinase [Cellvibrio sp. pealriver]
MQSIPGYHIKTLIGEGGMAKVYLAVQKSLDRAVAIKVLDARLNQDPIIQQQFEQESLLIAKLSHPNIIQIIDKGINDAQLPYFVMPYIKSVSLETVLPRNDISITRKLDVLIQLCSALAYAHRNGIVHRDIKPANVLVDYDGRAYLVDFGIAGYFTANKNAPTSETEMVMGTDAYMAPEQYNGTSHTNQMSDIYSLGVLIHEVIFGVTPRHATEQTYALPTTDKYQMANALRPIINRCIETNPELRPRSVDEIRQQLLIISQGRHLHSNRWSTESTRDNIPPNYTLLDVLKENPFGATYLVNDPKHQRFLVIKKQNVNHLGNAPQYAAKLMQVQHPHIARIYGTGKNPRVFISAMEYLPYGNLQERLNQTIEADQCLSIAQQLFNALACAHSYGIVHGNLRPSNILFAGKQHLKLSDFGFPSHSYGEDSHWYQPADQTINNAPSFATDVYAIGAILFQILTGTPPKCEWWGLKNRWQLRKTARPISKLILKIIHTNPNKRITSADQAATAFNQLQGAQQTQISATTPKG